MRIERVAACWLSAVLAFAIPAGVASAEDVSVWKFGSPQQERAYFAQKNDGFKGATLKVELFDFDARFQKIAAGNAAGNLPNVLVIENSMLPSLVKSNVLLDLEAAGADRIAKWKANFVPALWQLGTVGGKLYGFSPYVDLSPMLLYNRKILEAAGVKPPTPWA